MESLPRPLSPNELRDRLKAQQLLREIQRNEDIALAAESMRFGVLQMAFAARYRELTGIDPTERGETRDAIMRLIEGSAAPAFDPHFRPSPEVI